MWQMFILLYLTELLFGVRVVHVKIYLLTKFQIPSSSHLEVIAM